MSIILSAIAVECFLTGAFIQWKGLEVYLRNGNRASRQEEDCWAEEYRRRLSLLQAADFVSNYLVGCKFDDFVAGSLSANATIAKFSLAPGQSTKQYFYDELFVRRNQIMHWGLVNHEKKTSDTCLNIATSIAWIVKAMDKQRLIEIENSWNQARWP